MESQDENPEVFMSEEEQREDEEEKEAATKNESVSVSEKRIHQRRVSDVIDSLLENMEMYQLEFSRRSSTKSTDLTLTDRGYSTGTDLSTPKSTTNSEDPQSSCDPGSAHVFFPDSVKRVADTQDSAAFVQPMDEAPTLPTRSVGPELTARMPVDRDDDCYNMNHTYRGKCVVFNHDKSDLGFDDRDGSDVDVKKIQTTFEKLHFEVEILPNLSKKEVMTRLAELSEDDHEDRDCIVVFVLTHGLSDDFICAKDKFYKVDEIWEPFTADKCKTLAGKPKIFFIQACRGSGLDDGITLTRGSRLRTPAVAQVDSVFSHASYKIPTHADFLITYSSVKGFYAWRHPKEGSWFVETLCEVFNEYAHKTDLLKMLTITSKRVAVGKASFDDLHLDFNDKKQVPCVTSMLLRDVFFTPKEPAAQTSQFELSAEAQSEQLDDQ